MTTPRGSCDTCGKRLGLLPNGKIPSHLSPFDRRTICKGSNLPPEVESYTQDSGACQPGGRTDAERAASFNSSRAPDAARIYDFKIGESMSRDGWWIVKQRIASGSGSWHVVASVDGEKRAEIVRDALSEEANERV